MTHQQVNINDGLENVVANLGTARDKAAHTHFVDSVYTDDQLLTMYRVSSVSKRIINNPAYDATRKWRAWKGDVEQNEKIKALEESLYLQKVVREAMVSARLYGGSAIYINAADHDQTAPLQVGETIKSLVVLGRNQLTPGPVVQDINSEYYGWPEYFLLATEGRNSTEIHVSRFALFKGELIPAGSTNLTNNASYWGDSVLQSVIDEVKQLGSTMANIASLVFEAKIDVFKFDGFASLLAEGGDDTILKRAHLQAAMKGINGAVVIDAKDDYEQKNASFGGLPELISKFQDAVAGAAGQPVTRIFSRASAGLSGNGDGDERIYYDNVAITQVDNSQALSLLDRCVAHQAAGDESIDYEWVPLRQTTTTENADILSKIATAARNLAGANAGQIIPINALSDAVVAELVSQGVLSGLAGAIKEYGTLEEQEGAYTNDY